MFKYLNMWVFVCLSLLSPLFAQNFDVRIVRLSSLSDKQKADSLSKLLSDLSLNKRETDLLFTRKLLLESDHLKGIDYFFVLRHYANIAPSGNQMLIDSCLHFALQNRLEQYVSSLYVMKINFFKKSGHYDSAMIYTLKARDHAIKNKNIEQQANTLTLLGDLYYAAGVYEKARPFYLDAQRIKGNEDSWQNWRRRVLRNNLALIDIQTGNYNQAVELLLDSRKEVGNKTANYIDSVALAYILGRLAAAFTGLKEIDMACIYLDSACRLLKPAYYSSEWYSIMLVKAKLSMLKSEPEKAWAAIKEADQFSLGQTPDPVEKNEFLLIKTMLYENKGDFENALELYKQYSAIKVSLQNKRCISQTLQIKSENDYKKLKDNVNTLVIQRNLYIFLFLMGIMVVFIIGLMYVRIKRKNVQLVAMAVKNVSENTGKPSVYKSNNANSIHENSGSNVASEYSVLIDRLIALVEHDKVFLQPSLSLNKLAQMLGTNRTYLSNAINKEFGLNFNSYLNTLRIQESILVISKGGAESNNIALLAAASGFGNRTSFTEAFKKYTGLTPSTFISNFKKLEKEKI